MTSSSFASIRAIRGLSLTAIVFASSGAIAADVFFFDTPAAKRAQAKPRREAGVVVAAPAVAANAAFGADANARARPLFAQFKPALQAELSLVKRACKLDAARLDEVVAAAKGALWDYAQELAKDPNKLNQFQQGAWIVRARAGAVVRERVQVDSIEDRIAAAIKEELSDEERQVYEREVAARKAFVKATTIDCFVAQLDERLALFAKQRKEIAEALDRGWDPKWAPPLSQFIEMQQYLPAVPDEWVAPHLTPEQKIVWNGIDKISFGGMRNQIFHMLPGVAQPIGDVELGDDP